MDLNREKLERDYQADSWNPLVLQSLINHYQRTNWLYKGKTLSQWFEQLDAKSPKDTEHAIIRCGELGPIAQQCLPKLTRLLEQQPFFAPLQTALGCIDLNSIHQVMQYYGGWSESSLASEVCQAWRKAWPLLFGTFEAETVDYRGHFYNELLKQKRTPPWHQDHRFENFFIQAIPHLIVDLSSGRYHRQVSAVKTLSHFVHRHDSVIPALIDLVDPHDDEIHPQIRTAVARTLLEAKPAVPHGIYVACTGYNEFTKQQITDYMNELGAQAIPFVAKALDYGDNSWLDQKRYIDFLLGFGPQAKEAIPQLLSYLGTCKGAVTQFLSDLNQEVIPHLALILAGPRAVNFILAKKEFLFELSKDIGPAIIPSYISVFDLSEDDEYCWDRRVSKAQNLVLELLKEMDFDDRSKAFLWSFTIGKLQQDQADEDWGPLELLIHHKIALDHYKGDFESLLPVLISLLFEVEHQVIWAADTLVILANKGRIEVSRALSDALLKTEYNYDALEHIELTLNQIDNDKIDRAALESALEKTQDERQEFVLRTQLQRTLGSQSSKP